jgi:uncharacterized protein YbbC (DUF1343 family)
VIPGAAGQATTSRSGEAPGPVPASGMERLCAGLVGKGPEPLDAALMTRVRRAAGLLTHPAAVNRGLTSAVDALLEAGAGLKLLFGPEHGVRGEAADGRAVPGSVDARTGLPVHSLYRGGPLAAQTPLPAMFEGLEVLLIDLQDVGARFYTYGSTVSLCMEAAAARELPVVVLDRLNPIGPAIEGPLLQPDFASFVGLHPIPIRHGCTLGELAILYHRAYGVGSEPSVVAGDAASPLPTTHYPPPTTWVPPSPNMPSPLTALVYPGTALLEGTNVSEGRGTAKPFEWLGAPWVEAEALADRLNAFGLPGARFRPVSFIPSASKWAGETCGGVQLHVVDPDEFRPVLSGVAVLSALRELWPDQFAWREREGDFSVDRLAGTDQLRLAVDDGMDPAAIAASWREDEASFLVLRTRTLSRTTKVLASP